MSNEALRGAATGKPSGPPAAPPSILDYLARPKVQSSLAAVASAHLRPDKMLKIVVNAIKKTPKLLWCDPQTVLGAIMTSTALGLEPNTVLQQCFLIPYKKRVKNDRGQWVDAYECQFQIGARGFITLAYRSASIKRLSANCIHEHDHWKHLEGSSSLLEWSPKLGGERGPAIGAYSHAHLADGYETAVVLPIDELLKIRARSETWKTLRLAADSSEGAERTKAQAKLAETPWEMWFDDMAVKSAIKKHAKWLPLNSGDALALAADIDSKAESQVLDLGSLGDVDALRQMMEAGESPELPQLEHDPAEQLEGLNDLQPAREREPAQAFTSAAKPAAKKAATRKDDTPQEGNPAKLTYAAVADLIMKAKTADQVDLVIDQARHLPADQQQELAGLRADQLAQLERK